MLNAYMELQTFRHMPVKVSQQVCREILSVKEKYIWPLGIYWHFSSTYMISYNMYNFNTALRPVNIVEEKQTYLQCIISQQFNGKDS